MTASPAILVRGIDPRDHAFLLPLVSHSGHRLIGSPWTDAVLLRDTHDVPITPLSINRYHSSKELRVAAYAALATPRLAESLDLDPATWARVRRALHEHLTLHLPEAAAIANTIDECLVREDVRLVLLRNALSLADRTIALVAKRRGVPVAHLPHAHPAATVLEQRGSDQAAADLTLCYGPSSVEWYRRHGFSDTQLTVTGNPSWDHYNTTNIGTREATFAPLNLDPKVPTILFATTWRGQVQALDFAVPDWPQRYVDVTFAALTQLATERPFQLVLKVHPATTPSPAAWANERLPVLNRLPFPVAVIAGGRTDPSLLGLMDLVICIESNVGIEATLVDISAINLRFDELPIDQEAILFRAESSVMTVSAPQDMLIGIRTTTSNPVYREALALKRREDWAWWNGPNDGRAWKRVAHALGGML